MLTTAGFNRRMRKTARPVVWKAHGAQSPWAHPIETKETSSEVLKRKNGVLCISFQRKL